MNLTSGVFPVKHSCLHNKIKEKSGTTIMATFGDNSFSTILKFLKFLTKLLGHAMPYSAAIIEVWLDKTFVYFNCSVH